MRLVSLVFILGLMVSGTPVGAQTVPHSPEQIQLSFAPIVRQVTPAVVNIYTRKTVRTMSPFMADPFFRQFFAGIPQKRMENSLGSGVIVKSDGTIVTNNHVIRDADQITVILSDRREFEAKLLGADEHTDIAVLKIDAGGQALPVLPLGDSDSVEVGDIILAIGNPFGVGQTVTMGIVSALARTSVDISDYRSFIQTDAAINPGNSGGAMVDLKGRLVGINSAIASPGQGGGSVGIGFAIPVSMVKVVLASFTNGGKTVLRPWLGAAEQPVTSEMASSLHLARPTGALVNAVQVGGPAEQGGLKVGDVITAVNGREIDDPEGLKFRIATLAIGSVAQVTVSRGGQERILAVRLAAPPEQPPRDTTEIGGETPFTGATVANVNPALAEELGLDASPGGVVILNIGNGSIAQNLRLQKGDIIAKVNGRAVASVAELRTLLEQPARRWVYTVRRGGEAITMTVGG